MVQKRIDALLIGTNVFFRNRRVQLARWRRATHCRRSILTASSSKLAACELRD